MKPSQNDEILARLRLNGSITPIEALVDFGCFRLASRIWELRREGHLIVNQPLTVNGKTYACYVLTEQRTLDEEVVGYINPDGSGEGNWVQR